MNPRRRSGRWGLGVLTASALALAACGSGTSGSNDGPGAEGDMSIAEMESDLATFADPVTDLPEVAPIENAASLAGKTVWWVPLGPQLDASFGATLKEALGELDVEMRTCDGEFLPTTVASCLQQAADQGADAVVTGFVDYTSVPTAFDELTTEGIPVLLAGAVNNSDQQQSAEFAVADTTELLKRSARTQLELAITESDGTANIMWVGLDDSEQLKSVSEYAKSFVENNCPDCSFEQLNTNSASLTKLASGAGAALTSNPDTDYVVAQSDTAVPGVVQAIRTTGKQDLVKVIGNGALPDTMATLQGGDSPVVADSGVSLSYMAWGFADSITRMLTGATPPEQVQSLHRLFTPDNTKALTISPEAFNSVDWYADGGAVAKSFTDAWGVS
jgi:ABC-type sugar transport system substrate-binding protein